MSTKTRASGRAESGRAHKKSRTEAAKITVKHTDHTEEDFDFLIVAGDPQDGLTDAVLKKSSKESAVFDTGVMKSFTFQTTLMKFKKADFDLPTVRFVPKNMNETAGALYGYRSETRKELYYLAVEKVKADGTGSITGEFRTLFEQVDYEYITLYQLLDPVRHGQMTEKELAEKLDRDMRNRVYASFFSYPWKEGERITGFHTKYFNHFTEEAVKTGPWNYLRLQGDNNTVYVHASTAFESVLHIYNYIRLLFETKSSIFPKDKASRIAVVGGGPSGLLIARALVKHRYTNITILEQKPNDSDPDSSMFAGKTQTHIIDQFEQKIPAELGTCYLSPAYDHMVGDFRQSGILQGQDRVSFDQVPTGPVLREIGTEDQFHPTGPVLTLAAHNPAIVNFAKLPPTMNFEDYALLKGFEEHYAGTDLSGPALVEKYKNFPSVVAAAVIKYIALHTLVFGDKRPFPPQRGVVLQLAGLEAPIPDFLIKHEFQCLTGTLQYGYSVQGYGSIAENSTMPAIYMLMWITPSVFIASLGNKLKGMIRAFLRDELPPQMFKDHWFDDTPIVTAWTKGWGDIWRQLKEQFEEHGSGVTIQYNVNLEKISRTGVD